jgi:hypothetical protein
MSGRRFDGPEAGGFSMNPGQVLILGVLGFSVYLGWRYSRGGGAGSLPLYVVSVVVVLSLLGAAGAEALDLAGAVEALNVTAIALSLAAMTSGPGLWEEAIRGDLQRTRLYHAIRLRDFLSWVGWLKLVDRAGATRAALTYLGIFGIAVASEILVARDRRLASEGQFFYVALAAPGLFAVLSTIWIHQGARRVIPGA